MIEVVGALRFSASRSAKTQVMDQNHAKVCSDEPILAGNGCMSCHQFCAESKSFDLTRIWLLAFLIPFVWHLRVPFELLHDVLPWRPSPKAVILA